MDDRIPLESLPTRFHSAEQVRIWHTRRVILDSATFKEAASRLGITQKTLNAWRAKYQLDERPEQQ